MTTDASYSVELLQFAGLDDGPAAQALAKAFGIPIDVSNKFIARAPTVVKSKLTRIDADSYVAMLLAAGADVRVSCSRTGEERVYSADSCSPSDSPDEHLGDASFGARTVSGSYQVAGPAARPPTAPIPAVNERSTGQDAIEPPAAQFARNDSGLVHSPSGSHSSLNGASYEHASGNPFARRSSSSQTPVPKPASGGFAATHSEVECPKCRVRQPKAAVCAACGIVFQKYVNRNREAAIASGSYPSTDSDSFERATVGTANHHSVTARCDSCDRQRDYAGGTCRHCGWDNDRHIRRCIKCGGTTQLTYRRLSMIYTTTALLGALVAVGLAFTWGVQSALLALATSAAIVTIIFAVAVRQQCARCDEPVNLQHLKVSERSELTRRRLLLSAGTIGCVVAVAYVLTGGILSGPSLSLSTNDFMYRTMLPDNSSDAVQGDQTMETPVGQALVLESSAEADGLVFFLAVVDTQTNSDLSQSLDSGALAPAIAGALGGEGEVYESYPIAHNGRQGTELVTSVPYQGHNITTRGRLLLVGDEIVFWGVGALPSSGTESSPTISDFLESLEISSNN